MTPTLDQYVSAYLGLMRAQPRSKTVFTPAGKAEVHSPGERILFGPRGEKIRVIEDEAHNTQVEHGDHLHAVVRPQPLRIRLPLSQAAALASGAARPRPIRTTMTPKGIE